MNLSSHQDVVVFMLFGVSLPSHHSKLGDSPRTLLDHINTSEHGGCHRICGIIEFKFTGDGRNT